ncbi:hypothetical protein [Mycobacterium decipiens]|uniref:Uncharacterized protein n=1 Tax=Mycobacterium decipiens TaxID=1430326 RepID=A0A1X2M047_9MYCO|nr:hypothetical protein [Mycobacterium decipiens]OSC42980.1 hypothetical protein B8W66_00745 [Mycobacterium decipiens]
MTGADRWDVAGRLAEGRPAVEHTQSYVRACQLVGYQHPDLTSHPAQIRDWYDGEDGLDLHTLDGDCARLRAAGTVLTEALRIQRSQIAALAAAWTGSGADAAGHFLQRHWEAGNIVASEVRAAAQRCESLRDKLWHLVDAKVATAIAIDDRTVAQRPAWLAAAAAVTSGVADRSAADELVRQQITPYVDNDIRADWLTAMRSTTAGMAASYDVVTDRLATAPRPHFEIPGDLGPSRQPFLSPLPIQPPAAAVAPAAALPAPSPEPAPAMPPPPAIPSDLAAAPGYASTPAGAGTAAGLGDVGGADGLGGLAGLASRIVQAMDSLLGSPTEQLGDPLAANNPPGALDFDDEDATDDADDKDDPEPERADESETGDESEEPDAAAVAEEAEEPKPGADITEEAAMASVGEPPPTDVPPVAEPPPPAVPPLVNGSPPHPPSEGSTPCEIAADELPQAGP